MEIKKSKLEPAEYARSLYEAAEAEGTASTLEKTLHLLAEQSDWMNRVAREFSQLVASRRGRVGVEVVTAVPLTGELSLQLTNKLTKVLGKEVYLKPRVDSSILGGIVVRFGGRVADLSLKKRLEDLKQQMGRAGGG